MIGFVDKILNAMYTYQRDNLITSQCVTNTQYMYDLMKNKYPQEDIKTVPVICYAEHDEEQCCVVVAHVVVECNGSVIDPSYETVSQNCSYIFTLQEFLKRVPQLQYKWKRTIIEKFVDLSKLTERINNGEFVICDKEFYKEQHFFVEKLLN
jgi:hypothetical protein